MMRLLKVELTRFRSRRVNQLAVLGIIGVLMVMLFGTWQSSKPPSAAEMEEWILPTYESNLKDWEENGEQYLADCLASQEADPVNEYGCDYYATPPTIEDFYNQSPTFAANAASVLPSSGILLVFAAFAMGVSFIAAEFSSGAIGNWLTFEPRRGRVYGTKVGASGISVLPIGLLFGVLAVGGAWAANSLNDNVGTVTSETWRDIGQSGVRVLAAAVAFAMLGVAIGAIVRHTAAALGIILGYAIIVEGIVGGFFESVRPWLLQLNLQAVLNDGASYNRTVCEMGPSGEQCQWIETAVSLGHGTAVIGVVVVVAIAVAALVFRRRDVN